MDLGIALCLFGLLLARSLCPAKDTELILLSTCFFILLSVFFLSVDSTFHLYIYILSASPCLLIFILLIDPVIISSFFQTSMPGNDINTGLDIDSVPGDLCPVPIFSDNAL